MAEKSIVCPNCGGPVPPNTTSASLSCGYCKHHFKNPLYEKPQPPKTTPAVPASSGLNKTVLWIVLASVLGFPLIIGGVIFGISYYAVNKTQEFSDALQKKAKAAQGEAIAAQLSSVQSQEAAPLPKDVQMEQKLGVYIDCISESFATAEQAMNRYRAWMKTPKRGPNCKERYISYGLHDLHDYVVERCGKMAEANQMPPTMPEIQSAANAHLTALNAAKPVFDDANTYYDQERYALDDCKKAKELHPKLMGTYADIENTYKTMYALLADRAKGTLARCLARTGKDPALKGAHEWAAFISSAQQLVNAFGNEYKKKSPDVKGMKQRATTLVEKIEALQSLPEAQLKTAGLGHSVESATGGFIESVLAFIKAKGGKKLSHSARFFIRNGNDRSQYAGTFEHLQVKFNEMITGYNRDMAHCGALLLCTDTGCPER